MEDLAIVYPDSDSPGLHEHLVTLCSESGFTVDVREPNRDPQFVSQSLPDAAHVLFIPLCEVDCIGVKIIQLAKLGNSEDAASERHPRITVLYGRSLPSLEYMSLAFREGADDVIAVESDESQLGNQIRRALARLRTVRREYDLVRTEVRETRELVLRCEELERASSRWQERVHALARTAAALAIGDLNIKRVQPTLLVVSRSEAMTKIAVHCAEQLHFLTRSAVDAKAAVELMTEDPADVVLSDARLSDADAPGLAMQIRSIATGKRSYFIAWSSDAEAESWLLAPDQGMDDFVLKRNDSSANLLLSAALLRGVAPR